MRNFVAGTKPEDSRRYLAARDDTGKVHKLLAENQNDWTSRGPKWRILGPWVDPAEAAARKAAEASAEAEDETEDDDDKSETTDTATPTQGDEALKELHDLRAKAESRGVKVNEQWGKRRLQNEIDAATLRHKQNPQ